MSLLAIARARLRGEYTVDEWGLDPEIHDAAMDLGRLRWNIEIEGAENVPTTGPALLVVQRRVGLSEQAVVAVGVATSTDRRVRSAGIPGVRAAEAASRLVGAALAHPAETTALLRDGHIVSVGLGWSPIHDDPGSISADVMAGPLSLDTPVLPVAVRGREWGRTWRVLVGEPVQLRDRGGQPNSADAAERVRSEVRRLADRLGTGRCLGR